MTSDGNQRSIGDAVDVKIEDVTFGIQYEGNAAFATSGFSWAA